MNPATTLLSCLYGPNIPARIEALVEADTDTADLVNFKLNPVLNSNEHRLTRIAFARKGARKNWIQRISTLWENPAAAIFLTAAPPHARQMIDTDGGKNFVVYNDDLQPPPQPLLALTLAVPTGGPGTITRVPEPPADLPENMAAGVRTLRDTGVAGQWAIRVENNEVMGVLWVSESRWRGDAEQTTKIVLGLPMAPGWMDRWRDIVSAGFRPYPDAVEFRRDGTVDLTVGFLDAEVS